MARIAPPRDESGRFDRSVNPRPHRVPIRVTPEEARELEDLGGPDGVSGYVRDRAMARRVTSAADQSAIEALIEVTRWQKQLLDDGASATATAGVVAGVLDEVRRIRAQFAARCAGLSGRIAQAKPPEDKDRTKVITIRISDDEQATAAVDSTASKRTISAYLRDRAMGYPVVSATDQVMRGLLLKTAALQKHWYNECGQHADTTAAILGEISGALKALKEAGERS